MPTIGLVVSKPFGYSETFYYLDVQTWERLGYDVKVIPIRKGSINTTGKFLAPSPPNPLSQNKFIRGCQLLKSTLKLIIHIRLLTNSLRFIKAEWLERNTLRNIFSRLYANQHILQLTPIDILIFGYGNLALTRENIGTALRAKTIVSFKGSDIKTFPHEFYYNIYTTLFKRDFIFYFVSKALRHEAMKFGFPPSKPYYIIPAYIDSYSMPNPKPSLINNEPLRLLAVGRLTWVKGHIYLILALSLLIRSGVNFRLQIIGGGEQYQQLFWACKELGLLDLVTFTGILSKEETLEQMRQSDLLVHPSLSEGTPNVVLEALYLKLPCIVANWPGADEIICHQWNGWIVKKRSPEAIANQIEAFLYFSAIEKEKITANGSATIQETFNAQTQEAAFQRLLADALPGS
jgi:colanic acid/amylovoran biosynthesis glycosyltransferase